MWELAALKEREPGDDLMSRLITDYVDKGELNRETAVMNCVILLQAGHETTASMISLGTVALLQHPDALERLRRTDDPVLVANVVEELMRYLTIVHTQVDRVALEDLTINGQLIRAGDHVLMNLPAGNWDADIRRQSRHPRRRPKPARAPRLRLRRAPVHRAEPRPRRTAGRPRDARPPSTRPAIGGTGGGAELRRRAGDLHHPRAAGHLVTQLSP